MTVAGAGSADGEPIRVYFAEAGALFVSPVATPIASIVSVETVIGAVYLVDAVVGVAHSK